MEILGIMMGVPPGTIVLWLRKGQPNPQMQVLSNLCLLAILLFSALVYSPIRRLFIQRKPDSLWSTLRPKQWAQNGTDASFLRHSRSFSPAGWVVFMTRSNVFHLHTWTRKRTIQGSIKYGEPKLIENRLYDGPKPEPCFFTPSISSNHFPPSF